MKTSEIMVHQLYILEQFITKTAHGQSTQIPGKGIFELSLQSILVCHKEVEFDFSRFT